MPSSQVKLNELSPGEDDGDDKPKRTTQRSRRTTQRAESELVSRLYNCFERIANALRDRGDHELAEAVEEDAQVMAAGLVSMTKPIAVLRTPLVILVALVEPLLAFGRIFRIIAGRIMVRRAERQQEVEYAAAQAAEHES